MPFSELKNFGLPAWLRGEEYIYFEQDSLEVNEKETHSRPNYNIAAFAPIN
jgi:hypothetical protein